MSIRSRGIRAQIRKLSEIATNFGSFFALSNFIGGSLLKFWCTLSPWHRLTSPGKVSRS